MNTILVLRPKESPIFRSKESPIWRPILTISELHLLSEQIPILGMCHLSFVAATERPFLLVVVVVVVVAAVAATERPFFLTVLLSQHDRASFSEVSTSLEDVVLSLSSLFLSPQLPQLPLNSPSTSSTPL